MSASFVLAATGDGCGGNPICAGTQAISNAINSVGQAASFWTDPWGNTFKALQSAASGLANNVLPALSSAAMPDLNASWFVNAYRVSFALAIFMAIVLLFPQFVRTARGQQAGRELVDSVGIYFGLFLVGAMFGPALGIILVNFFNSLSDVLIGWGIQGSTNQVVSQFQTMINNTDPTGMAGGIVVATFLMFCMLLGLLIVVLMLIVMLVTLYFAGVLLPLSLVWIIDPNRRAFGMKLAGVWVGVLASHPLLLLLLGFTYNMTAANVNAFGNNASLQSLVTLAVAVIALFLAAASPLMLMKFAPVIPVGAANPGQVSRQSQSIGSPNLHDATTRYGEGNSSASRSVGSSSDSVAASSAEAGSGTALGGGLAEAAALRSGVPSGPGGALASGGETSSGAAGASGMTGTAGAAEGASAGAEAGMAAGAAESATGVGAAIGVPTMIAAGAAMAAKKGVDVTQQAGELATSHMEEQ
jgi:type IV secretion system protein TrbL